MIQIIRGIYLSRLEIFNLETARMSNLLTKDITHNVFINSENIIDKIKDRQDKWGRNSPIVFLLFINN